MIPVEFPRRLATLFLRFAIWIAPHDTHDWGHGMLSELNHVEGNWSAFLWSLGGAGVLAKHAILAVILPGSHRPSVSSASEIFAKELPMRKTTLAVIASCVVASLLLFLAPVFRQAFRVSLAQWHDVFHAKLSFGYPAEIQNWTLWRKKPNKIAMRKLSPLSRFATRMQSKGCASPTKPCISIRILPGSMRLLARRIYRLPK